MVRLNFFRFVVRAVKLKTSTLAKLNNETKLKMENIFSTTGFDVLFFISINPAGEIRNTADNIKKEKPIIVIYSLKLCLL